MYIRILSYLFAVSFAGADFVHAQTQADTLEWRGYYPLEIGNAWEWQTQSYWFAIDRREIIADTTIDGKDYFVQAAYTSLIDLLNGGGESSADTTLLRYDTLASRVVALTDVGEQEWEGHSCDLSAEFGTTISCAVVDGRYAYEGEYLVVGTDTIAFNAVKGFLSLGGGISYYHGIGPIPLMGDGNPGGREFTYLRLGGIEYGQQAVFVSTEAEPIPAKIGLAAYPNPARDRVSVELGATQGWVRVYNVLGRQVLQEEHCTGGQCVMDTRVLVPGLYFVQVIPSVGSERRGQFVIAR